MNRLSILRKNRGATQSEVAEMLGISQPTYNRYETGTHEPDNETVARLAKYFGVSADYLLGIDEHPRRITGKKWVPLLGSIPAGQEVEAIESIIGYLEVPENFYPNDTLFALTVTGDSMSPYYLPGDNVICRKAATAETGQDVAVRIGDNDATLKRFKKMDNGIALMPLNPAYQPYIFSEGEIAKLPVEILGVVVESRRTMDPPNNHKKVNGQK